MVGVTVFIPDVSPTTTSSRTTVVPEVASGRARRSGVRNSHRTCVGPTQCSRTVGLQDLVSSTVCVRQCECDVCSNGSRCLECNVVSVICITETQVRLVSKLEVTSHRVPSEGYELTTNVGGSVDPLVAVAVLIPEVGTTTTGGRVAIVPQVTCVRCRRCRVGNCH